MSRWILQHERELRIGFFLSILVLMMFWEILLPRRRLSLSRAKRWSANFLIVVIDTVCVRVLFPAAAVGIALYAQHHQMGLLNHFNVPFGFAVIIAIVLLDLTIYAQHVMFHYVPIFWRFHRMHHVDIDFDVSTGIRFHPVEIILSMLIKSGVILLLGPPAVGVLLFEILLNATSLFNHGNVKLFKFADRIIRAVIVTPDMHRVHHSIVPVETNSNFGFNFSFWDRLFRTYKAQPDAGHKNMSIGLNYFRDPKIAATLWGLLKIPFINKK